jgi:hypothetical protein
MPYYCDGMSLWAASGQYPSGVAAQGMKFQIQSVILLHVFLNSNAHQNRKHWTYGLRSNAFTIQLIKSDIRQKQDSLLLGRGILPFGSQVFEF